MRKFAFILLGALSVNLAFSGCSESAKQSADASKNQASDPKLSADLIQNPKSADPSQDDQAAMEKVPVMTFERDKWSFGEIVQGEIVEYSFRFTNTGNTPLVITSAKGSCGCTVPEYPKEPIAPGESSFLKVTYDSNGRRDQFDKTVTITANTVPNTNLLYISGNVIVPEG